MLGAAVAYLVLTGSPSRLRRTRRQRSEPAVARHRAGDCWSPIGIGLHNLGEGLAIGSAYAVGALALGAFLVIGFAIHNTTEGLAIVAPLADRSRRPARLLSLGLIAGAPAILGAWIGASAFNASIAAFLFGVGVGAIVQVIVQLCPGLRDRRRQRARCNRARRPHRRRAGPVRDRIAGQCLSQSPLRRPRPRPARSDAEAIENYAKAIYALAAREPGPVGTTALAERLGVTPATVTAMVKRMAELGLVSYEPYQGVKLTAPGERMALEVIRHHRLLESFLAEALGMPWDRVHDEAEVLEHYISEDLEERIAAAARRPGARPARRPDPGSRPDHHRSGSRDPADRARAGRRRRLHPGVGRTPRDAPLPRQHEIRPGARLEVLRREPFGGAVVIGCEGGECPLGPDLAARMLVVPGGDR